MSRHIQDVASIQFQVNTRQANGAMKAMQEAAIELGRYINDVNRKIANLGEGAVPENPAFVELDNQLKGYMKRLNDVQKAQKDFMRGAKAADQLTKAAAEGNIESLSFRAIKAGQNGLRKRQEGLSPGDAKDMKEWRIIENVIKEAQRIVNEASADVQHTIQTIREGGKVSEQNMRQTINTLRDLKGSVDETDADFVHWGNDLDFMEAKFKEFGENQRRLKGELVDANDARREMEKLSEQGTKTAEQERQAAEQLIDTYKKEGEQLAQNRAEIKQNIADTQKEMEQQHQLIESKHEELAKAEEVFGVEQAGRREALDGLQQQAEKERKLANEKADQAELQRQAAEVQKQQTEQLGQKVTEITEKLAAIQAQKAAPNPTMESVKTSAREANAELDDIERKLKNIATLKGESQKVVDDFEAKYGKAEDERFEKQEALRKEAIRKDEVARKQAVENVEQKWQEYWRKQEEQAKQFAATLGKSLEELDLSEISKHLDGPQAAKAKAAYRVVASKDYELGEALFGEGELNQDKEWAKRYEGDDSPTAKIIESMQRKYREYIKEVREAENVDTEAAAVRKKLTEENTKYFTALGELEGYQQVENKLLEQKTGLQQQQTQAQHQQNEETEEEIKLKQDLKTFQDLYNESYDAQNTKLREANKLQGEAIEQQKKAEQAEGAAAKAQGEMIDKQAEFNAQQQEGLKEVGEMSKGYTDLTAKMTTYGAQLQANDEATQKNAENMAAAEQRKQQNASLSIKRMEEMLALLQKEYYQEGVNAEAHEEHAKTIQQLEKVIAEERGKATLQMMTERMDDLGKLSNSAFEETKRFWQAMEQGADKGSAKLTEAQENLKKLVEEERTRNEESAGKVIGDMGSFSDKEIADAVKMFEQMRDSLARTDDKWKEFNEQAQKGIEYLEQMKKQDALEKMEERMSHLSTLSDAARAETKKFFEALKLGAEKGSEDLKKAEAALKNIKELEKDRNQEKADILLRGTLNNYSESEIREAIEAAKAFRNELATGDKEAERYAEAIAKAEAHVKKYGVETARAAQKQKENDDLMRAQLTRMFNDMYAGAGMPSESQLKAQKQYWQRLIDDPKTAASSLNEYRNALAEVEKMEADMVKIGGQTALAWFGQGSDKNASENQIKEMAAKLKEYRGTLLKETNADEIEQIDAILQRVGQSAKKAAEELMSVDDAIELGEKAFNNVYKSKEPAFFASPEEIQAATKALENYREEIFKIIKAKKSMGESTQHEEDLLEVLADDLKALKFEQDNFNMSREKMEALISTPTKATSLDELRAAIKRADGELKRMYDSLGDNKEEYKAFAKQVKEAKNTLKDMEGQAKATSSVWEKAWSRLKTYVGMYMGFNMAWQRVTGSVDDLMTLSDKMGEVRKTTGFTTEEVGRLSENLKKLDVRTPLDQLMEISAKAGQLGLKSQEDVQGFTEAANKLMIALPEMGTEAATEMMKVAIATGEVKKIQDQMNKGLIDGSSATEVALSKVGSTIDQLRANSAASAPAITDFVKRVGAVGAQSGITIDQVAALGATVDALGMRVEMSATALSRMIPAIRNNAFQVANAIGMAPNALRAMFDEAGGGMEAMLAIFQHIKDSGMDADSIEKLLGMGGLKDVMKELNQQGARAGIVFAGLSQNVDELRRNLVTARDAYEDNIAILQEYNKMNDTTAAKWERFKNQIEELFVGNNAQRWLGYFIDGLRNIFELLTGNNGVAAVVRTIVVYLGFVKANLFALITSTKAWSLNLSKIAVTLGFIDKETKKLQWGNIFTALAAAALWAWHEIAMLKSALDKAHESLGKTREEIGHSIERFEGYWVRLEATSSALQKARASHESLSAEVDKLRKTTDGSAESTAELKKKEDELTNSEKNVTRASNDHKSAISQMNSIYGKYLGFILTETNYTNLAAAAHEKVASAIEREMLLKQRQAAIGEVDSNYSQNIAEGYGDLNERLVSYGKLDRRDAARAMSDMQRFMRENLKYNETTNETEVSESVINQLTKSGLNLRHADANVIAALWFDQYLKNNYHLSDRLRRGITGVKRIDSDQGWVPVRTPFSTNFRADYASTYAQRERDRGAVSAVYGVDISQSEEREAKAAGSLLKKLEATAKNAKNTILNKNTNEVDRNKAYGELANALEGLENRINELNPQKDAATINRLNDMATALKGEGIDIKKLKQAREKIHQTLFERATFNEEDIENLNTTNPWGSSHEASSTDWKNMTAEQLVERRKQMNEFVKAIQTDSDVQSVLGEDSALKAAIEKGMSSDMRTVINWYNTERLKIQDELHARYLTNTGAWKDPKQSRARRKRLQDDMKAYLEELDAYYTERKSRIDEARNDEEISEAEAWNRNIKNEAEWHRRRAELQIMYSKRAKEITAEEQQAIAEIIAERTGDDAKFIKATIDKTVKFSEAIRDMNEQGAKEYRKFQGDLDLGSEKDYNKVEKALGKHLKAMEDIINKERPFNGIVDSLQDNLGKMGILTADLGDDAKSAADELVRLTFLMGEAEKAYTMTVDQLLEDMRQHGFKEWADAISKDPNMQQGLLAMLRQTFDSVQDAIKKESGIIKKHVENMLLDVTEAAQAEDTRLQILQNSVSRANSLIGAGAASERVADKLAIKQIQLQITLQETRIRMLQKRGADAENMLRQEAELLREQGKLEEAKQKKMDADNIKKSVGLTLTKEQVELDKQRVSLAEKLEESQNRLYTTLREWATLLSSSVQSLMEATHAGDAEYYNELAKLNLTGKGGPGAGTYIVIDNEGTENAEAHYEYLDERAALERQHEIERQNAEAEAWRKVMDDLNNKLNEQITDWINASMQNASVDANTDATLKNTQALMEATAAMRGNSSSSGMEDISGTLQGNAASGTSSTSGASSLQSLTPEEAQDFAQNLGDNPMLFWAEQGDIAAKQMIEQNKKVQQSTQSMFAKMSFAANMYGLAYQTMSNDNLSAEQKFEMFALQAAGQAAIGMLTANLVQTEGQTAVELPGILGKAASQLGPIAGPIAFAAMMALLGGLMGMAVSKVTKSKAQIAQVTGASASVGRLSTGMMTYAEGNVNEFSDPASLTPGRSYNVDAADGKTYRAKYTGRNPSTHLTNGPEFHLAGEKGREMIIDAGTTRQITMNENEIWRTIKTLSGGGRITSSRRRGKGVRAFAEGNVEDFDTATTDNQTADMGFDPVAMKDSIDKNNELLERALTEGIKGVFDVYGPYGLVASYDKGKKNATRHGERY